MLNKKVLAAAVIGTLFAGGAAATDFTAASAAAYEASIGKFAKEIKTTTSATTATAFTGAGVNIKWESGYAYSPNEVRYVRIEAAPHVKFQAATTVAAAGGTGSVDVGAINGVGTNVITFSVTGDAITGAGSDVVFTLTGNVKLTAIEGSNVAVSLYDLPSQAQAGGSNGRIAGGSVDGEYFRFMNSLKWANAAETAVSDVEASPSFTLFTAATSNNATDTGADLNSALGIVLTGASKADSNAIAITDLLNTAAGQSTVTISGDFSWAASAGATPFDAAARARVGAFGTTPAAAGTLTASAAIFNITAPAAAVFSAAKAVPAASWNTVIPETTYTAKLNAVGVAANANVYNLPVLADVAVGEIVRNGTELQAPLAQIPGGWISRLVLTNTSGAARPYTISLLNVEGETAVTPGTLTGTIPANGTKVINDLTTVFTGNNRATIVVNVAGPDKAIQGLYQIVNPTSGSVSNHVMVRPGSN